jgi:PAS domain S-box-containing protein/putative nucleotidyltransferase with HDIG domain
MKEKTKSETGIQQALSVLIIDDSEDDVLLIIRELKKGGYDPVYERVQTAAALKKALRERPWDIILCDYKMPWLEAPSAIGLIKESNIDVPVIILSGSIGEEKAVGCMRLGAQDYIMKGNYSRLCPAIKRELAESENRQKKRQAEAQKETALDELRQSEEKYRTILDGIEEGYYEVDIEGNLTFFNDSMRRILGYSSEEMMGLNSRQFTDKENAKKLFQTFHEVYKTGRPSKGFDWQIISKEGRERFIEASVSLFKDSSGKPKGFKGIVRDITERRKAREILQESEKKYRLLTEKMTDIVWIVDENLRTVYVTPSVQKVLGFTQEERMNQTADQQLTPDSLSFALEIFYKEITIEDQGSEDPNRSATLILEYYHKNGSTIWMETIMSALRNDQGVAIGIHGVSRDITERRQAELARETALEELRKSEELQTRLVNAIPDIIVRTDLEGNILFVNDNTLRIGGYSREEMQGQNLITFISPEDHEEATKNLQLMMDGSLGPREYRLVNKDGRKIPFEVNGDVLRNKDGTPFGIVSVCRDISERKKTERILREKEERLRGITANLPGVIFQFYAKDSGEYGINYLSEPFDEFAKILSKIDMGNMDAIFPEFLSLIHEDDRERFVTSIKTAVDTVTRWNFEGRVALQSGKMIWFQGLSIPTRLEDRLIFDGILLNITERKQAEENSHLSEEKFRKIFMTTPDCIALTRLNDGTMIDVNKGFEDIVGWKREKVIGTKSTEPPMNFWVDLSDRDFMAKELKSGRDVLHREFEFRRSDGCVRKGVYSARTITIDEQECLVFILQDITERKLMDEELKRTLESLRKSVGTTIQVMVAAIEMKDPYTAGHQNKVADLARAIATEMELSHEKIDGLRMAGIIHDIGKLAVPAEILSKPTKLTDIEFSLIKEHSRSGYEMLKDVESPWPLAEIVYQHHERMDGSGYPRNLKGDEILIEARILAVADVVEAMASHRPYRASLGIDAALQEIEKNKGILYDSAVADACLRLFREKAFVLE